MKFKKLPAAWPWWAAAFVTVGLLLLTLQQIRLLERTVVLTVTADELFHRISLDTVSIMGRPYEAGHEPASWLEPLRHEVDAFIALQQSSLDILAISQSRDIRGPLEQYLQTLTALGQSANDLAKLSERYDNLLQALHPLLHDDSALSDAIHQLDRLTRLATQGDALSLPLISELHDRLIIRPGNPIALQDFLSVQNGLIQHWQQLDTLQHLLADNQQLAELLQWKSRLTQFVNVIKVRIYVLFALSMVMSFVIVCGVMLTRHQRLQTMTLQAQRLAQSRSEFLANMSHEIRTPMNAIIGFSALALQTELTAHQRDYLLKIKSASDTLLLLINDILDLSKVESGHLLLEETDFQLDELLESLATLFSELSEQKSIEVIIDKAPDVPAMLRGDPLRLGQVLINLVSNAIKFTERGIVRITLRRATDDAGRGEMLQVAVQDTGIGIGSDKLAMLFKPFSQLDASYSRQYGGTGLGLNISQRLVELMGGRIDVDSEVGKGSCFHFAIPLRAAIHQHETVRRQLSGSPSILLLEDNLLVSELLVKILERAGAHVVTCASLTAAEQAAREHADSLSMLLIDWRIGDEDGLELVARLAPHPKLNKLPVLVISAYERSGLNQRMSSLGLQHALSKPLTEHRLLDKVTELLAGQQPQPAAALNAESEEFTSLAGLRVLLAEDNRVNQQLLVEYLRRIGVETRVVENGLEALTALDQEAAFDLVLMDLQMPTMDGLEATQRLRERFAPDRLPVIALTASAMPEDRARCLAAGMNGYVTKPVGRRDLYQALLSFAPKRASSSLAALIAWPLFASEQALQRLGFDGDTLHLLAEQFVSEQSDVMLHLEQALSGNNKTLAHRLLEHLAELAGNLRADRLQQAALSLAANLRQPGSESITLSELQQIHRETLAELEHYLDLLPTPMAGVMLSARPGGRTIIK